MKINRNNYENHVIDYLEGNLSEEVNKAFELFLDQHQDIKNEIIDLLDISLPSDFTVFENKEKLKRPCEQEYEALDLLLAKKLENDLTDEEHKKVNLLLANDARAQKAWKLMQLTILRGTEEKSGLFSNLQFPDSIDYSIDENLMIGKLEGDLTPKQNKQADALIEANKKSFRLFQKTILTADKTLEYPHKEELQKTAALIPLWRKLAPVIAIAAMVLFGFFFYFNKTSTPIARSIQQISTSVPTQKTPRINKSIPSLIAEEAPVNTKNVSSKNNEIKIPKASISNPPIAEVNVAKEGKNQLSNKQFQDINITRANPITYKTIAALELKKTIQYHPTEKVIEPKKINEEDQFANHEPKEYQSFREFATDKAKKTLWGDEQYPTENYSVALLEKTVEKVEILDHTLPIVSKDDSGWEFRFKKFSVKRIKP